MLGISEKVPLRPSRPLWFNSSPRLRGELPALLLRLNSRLDRLVHLRVARAAAQVPAQGMADLFFARLRIAVQQRFHRDHETRCAEAALRAAPVAIGFLDRRQRAVVSNTFHCSDVRSVNFI